MVKTGVIYPGYVGMFDPRIKSRRYEKSNEVRLKVTEQDEKE